MAKARIDEVDGRAALTAWANSRESNADEASVPRSTLATAVRYTLQALADRVPGSSVEVRVPPFGAVQCVDGPGHSRGTPPNVIECDSETWLELATGRTLWAEAVADARVRASGTRADISLWLPVVRV